MVFTLPVCSDMPTHFCTPSQGAKKAFNSGTLGHRGAETREFVPGNILELWTLLHEAPWKLTQRSHHIGQWTPKHAEKGPVYDVDGAES
jgi:hypothetical protein